MLKKCCFLCRHPSPVMIRKTPLARAGMAAQLEEDDVVCVDDDDFAAEGFIDSGILR